ncbi:reverse transcriptase domain-containing protein, partial [Streptomyces sp. IBSBF 2390]|uniref:reverse transcriptase domain-containing protein n=1 Tax=Streptomyces sp. IBSBF 2390 TaxID=2903533 RepID=UPI003FA7B80D
MRHATRGTPQGGVISPLLWLLVVNDILLEIEASRLVKIVAYADDVILLSLGLFTITISSCFGKALSRLSNWATSCGLGYLTKVSGTLEIHSRRT